MSLSIVIPTIPGREAMLEDLLASLPQDHEIIICPQKEMSLSQKRNWGAKQSTGDYILFIDDDNVVELDAINKALEVIEYDRVGIVGFIGCYEGNRDKVCDSGSIRDFITTFTKDYYVNKDYSEILFNERKGAYEVDEVANAFMVRRDVFEELSGLDSYNFQMDLDEADFCFRVRKAGYRVVMATEARVYHKSQTYSRIPDFRRPLNAYNMGRNRIIFQRKHRLLLCYIPLFVCAYLAVIMARLKFNMVIPFIKGVYHGLYDTVKY